MIRLIISLAFLGSLIAVPVFAEERSAQTEAEVETQKVLKEQARKKAEALKEQQKTQREARKKALEAAKTAREDRKLETSRDLAEKLIAERAELLKKLASGEHTRKCRAEAKSEAITAINAAIARLGTITVSSATTADQVRTLIKNDIVGKNHVYVALLPAIRGMCASDRLIGLIETKIDPIVARLEAGGSNVASIKASLAAATTSAEEAYLAYKTLASSPGTATYRTDLSVAKNHLKTARQHLSAARDAIDALQSTSNDGTDGSSSSEISN